MMISGFTPSLLAMLQDGGAQGLVHVESDRCPTNSELWFLEQDEWEQTLFGLTCPMYVVIMIRPHVITKLLFDM